MKENNKKDAYVFELDGRNYYFDINAICSFITKSENGAVENNERLEREIYNSYEIDDEDEGLVLNSKTVREVTGPGDGTMPNIRYDLLKLFLIQIITFSEKDTVEIQDSKPCEVPIINIELLPLGTRIAFNSLLKEGFVKIRENKQ